MNETQPPTLEALAPATLPSVVLTAALASPRARSHAAQDLGVSVPALLIEALRLARDPLVAAGYPAECRRLLARASAHHHRGRVTVRG